MAVSFGTRIDDDTNFITEVDTEKKLAKTRGAIAGEAFVSSGARVTDTSGTLDVSYNDIFSMLNIGIVPFIVEELSTGMYGILNFVRAYIDDGRYTAEFYGGDPGDPIDKYYVNDDADDYLVFD